MPDLFKRHTGRLSPSFPDATSSKTIDEGMLKTCQLMKGRSLWFSDKVDQKVAHIKQYIRMAYVLLFRCLLHDFLQFLKS